MITVDGRPHEAGVAIVAWLRDALREPGMNPAEHSPAERLRPALRAATELERDRSLLALADAFDSADDELRIHLMWALDGFSTDALTQRYLDLLEPVPAEWITDETSQIGRRFFELLASCRAADDRLTHAMQSLAEQLDIGDPALIHFVTFHTTDHGWQAVVDHLDAGHGLGPTVAWYVGSRFARHAPHQLAEIATRIAGHDRGDREQLLEAASLRLDHDALGQLRAALDLDTRNEGDTSIDR